MKRFFTALALTALVGVLSPFVRANDYLFAEGDVLGGEVLSAEVATWLNGRKGSGVTKAEYESYLDNDSLSIEQEYLLNTSPINNSTIDFRISSIAVSNVVSMDVDLIRKNRDTLVTTPINGRLVIQRCNTPDGTFTGGFLVSGNSVTLPLKDNEPQKYYRAAVVRNADNFFFAAIPLKDGAGNRFKPDAEEAAGMNSVEISDDLLRSGIAFSIPTDLSGTQTCFIAMPTSYMNKLDWKDGSGSLPMDPPPDGNEGEQYSLTINGIAYTGILWYVPYEGACGFMLKLKN